MLVDCRRVSNNRRRRNMAVPDSQEHFFGIELTKDKPTYTWTFSEEDEEDEDGDFMVHTLFLKNAILGAAAVKGERNLIQIETKNFEKNEVKQPFVSLTLGQLDMCSIDVSFGHETPVTFRLVEGAGPICLGGQHLVEFPPDDELSQDESALDETEDDIEDEEEEEEEESPKKTSKKRKAPAQGKEKAKKGKVDESSADDSVEDDDEDDDEEEEMEEDEESSPDAKKKKKGKAVLINVKRLTVTVKPGSKRRIVKAKRRFQK